MSCGGAGFHVLEFWKPRNNQGGQRPSLQVRVCGTVVVGVATQLVSRPDGGDCKNCKTACGAAVRLQTALRSGAANTVKAYAAERRAFLRCGRGF